MAEQSRTPIIVGNWKMYKTIEEAISFVKELAPAVSKASGRVFLSVPFTAIKAVSDGTQDTNVVIGAQNMNDACEGAFTGEIAGRMLKDAGAKFVILGHSERRHIFNEGNELINSKVKQALLDRLTPILCVGETIEQREEGKMEQVLEEQLTQSLEGITDDQLTEMMLAYEPVWAIGTGHTATPEQAQEAHQFCRKLIEKNWGSDVANQVSILYGGSVKPGNAKDLMMKPDIDGLLVGGASLSTETFAQIVNYETIMCN